MLICAVCVVRVESDHHHFHTSQMSHTTRSGAAYGALEEAGGVASIEPERRNRSHRRPDAPDADSAHTVAASTLSAPASGAAGDAQRRVAAADGAAIDVSSGRLDGERAADEPDPRRQHSTRSSARCAAAARSAELSDDDLRMRAAVAQQQRQLREQRDLEPLQQIRSRQVARCQTLAARRTAEGPRHTSACDERT